MGSVDGSGASTRLSDTNRRELPEGWRRVQFQGADGNKGTPTIAVGVPFTIALRLSGGVID
jgi:hypothetical protein